MDTESKELLRDVLELTEENNRILKKVRGFQKMETFWKALKLIVLVGIAFGALYFLEPYFNKVVDTYNSVIETEQKIKDSSLIDFLKN